MSDDIGYLTIGDFHWLRLRSDRGRLHSENGCVGVSSTAMMRYAFGDGPRPHTPPSNALVYPHDPGDLDRCRNTLQLARDNHIDPAVIERMADVFAEFERWIDNGIGSDGNTGHPAHRWWVTP